MTQTQINELRIKADALRSQVEALEEEAYKEKRRNIDKGDIKEWLGFEFESSSGLTEEFISFNRDFRKAIRQLTGGYEIIGWSRGHFYCSGFLKNQKTGKTVYFSISDVRFFANAWYNDILIRKAKYDKDYTGGSNHSCKLPEFKAKADELTA